jgi:hypothetical protein
MRFLLILICCLFSMTTSIFCQKLPFPSNIEEAVKLLSSDMPDSLKLKIKTTDNDKLLEHVTPYGGNYDPIFTWSLQDSILINYFAASGISFYGHIEHIILIALKNHLNGKAIIPEQVIFPFKAIELKWEEEDKNRFTLDTLRGEYIPQDLQDCFKQIDRFWNDSIKNIVRNRTEEKFIASAHLGFGMWMRNNWQLWHGSRLTQYFNKIGIYHAENMSGMILSSYYRYLNGKALKLENQIRSYKYYWQISKMPDKNTFPVAAENMEFNTTYYYKSRKFKEGAVHAAEDSTTNFIWLFDFHLNWAKISREEFNELKKQKKNQFEHYLKKLYRKNKIRTDNKNSN